jgi:hypothetical protein
MSEIKSVYRGRHYWFHGDRVWFEECPVVHETNMFITVRSLTYPTIQYPGGDFRLSERNIKKFGKLYHSRHGEYFYLGKPRLGDLFPSKELLDSPDFVTQEAAALGWDISKPLHEWAEEDKACYILATTSKKPLAECVKLFAHHGIYGVEHAIYTFNMQQRERDLMLAFTEN